MPRTCLGTRLLKLGDARASLLVECNRETAGNHPILEIKVLVEPGESCYSCTLSPFAVSKGSSSSDILLSLGRLLLREDGSKNDAEDKWQKDKTVIFQFDDTHNLVLVVHENLSNGMKRRILKREMELSKGFDYVLAVGEALHESLQVTQQTKASRNHWKTTAQDLDNLQQQSKDTLLSNFCTLRNKMVQKHQAELEELKRAHQAEKLAWEKDHLATTSTSSSAQAKRRAKKKQPQEEPELATSELFAQDDMLALAQGRKLDAPKKLGGQKTRRAFLDANDVVDMVKIRKEGLEFEKNKTKNRNQSSPKQAKDEDRKTPDRRNETRKRPKKDLLEDDKEEDHFDGKRPKKGNFDDDEEDDFDIKRSKKSRFEDEDDFDRKRPKKSRIDNEEDDDFDIKWSTKSSFEHKDDFDRKRPKKGFDDEEDDDFDMKLSKRRRFEDDDDFDRKWPKKGRFNDEEADEFDKKLSKRRRFEKDDDFDGKRPKKSRLEDDSDDDRIRKARDGRNPTERWSSSKRAAVTSPSSASPKNAPPQMKPPPPGNGSDSSESSWILR